MKNISIIGLLMTITLITFQMGTADIAIKHSREVIVREKINTQLLTMYDGLYEVEKIVDVDSFLNDMRFYDEPLEDPYGTLHNCFIFTTLLREEALSTKPQTFNEVFDENYVGERVGIYKESSILWMSEPEIGNEPGRLFTTRDINNDGNVDILTRWGFNSEEIWIHSWDGRTGYRINKIKDYNFSVIEGMEGLFHLFDANGDGILEIKNMEYDNGADTWSWNGQLYGKWPDTPHLPETTMWPRNNFELKVNCSVRLNNDSLYYKYLVENKVTSKQRMNSFYVQVKSKDFKSTFPHGWDTGAHYLFNLKGWDTKVFDNTGLIWPGKSKNGFAFVSKALPVIAKYFAQADNDLPNSTQMSNQEYLNYIRTDLIKNTVQGYTIGPADPPAPFSTYGFIDTLIQYSEMADSIKWIADSSTTKKIITYFRNAKERLQQNDNTAAISVLDSVLTDVEADSGVTLTSEAYALIRYNTEYLKEQLTQSHVLPHNVRLLDSRGQLLPGGHLQYYEGSWQDAIDNGDGTFLVKTERSAVSLRMTYEGGSETRQNVPVTGDMVIFRTRQVSVQLKNSQGQLMDEGSVQYYAAGWKELGTTTGGIATKELLPLPYSFRMSYEYAAIDKKQDTGQDSVVVFQTVAARVELRNSNSDLMPAPEGDEGRVQYYAGAWRDLGTTSGGVAGKELLPKQYSFRMTHAFASVDKQQDIGADPAVVFQTVNARVELRNSAGNLMSAPERDEGRVQYYAGPGGIWESPPAGLPAWSCCPDNTPSE